MIKKKNKTQEKIKRNIIKKIKNTYCRLQSSKISGVGVFAVQDIPRGVNPFQGVHAQKWYELSISDFGKLKKEVRQMMDDFFVIEKDNAVWVPEGGLVDMDISFFVNHSKRPNLKTTNGGSFFVTLRKIKKGEELTIDYGNYDWKYK